MMENYVILILEGNVVDVYTTCDTLKQVKEVMDDFQEYGEPEATLFFARVYTDAAYKLKVGD